MANLWFRIQLNNRFQYTQINDISSNLRLITTGVPQGSTLRPLLYFIYVNDIFNASLTYKCILYADDTTVVITGSSLDNLMLESKTMLTLFALVFDWFASPK